MKETYLQYVSGEECQALQNQEATLKEYIVKLQKFANDKYYQRGGGATISLNDSI